MAVVQWTSSSGGDWQTAADWGGGAVPLSTDDVQIEVAGITVTVSTGVQAAASLTTVGSTLSVDGGTLSISGTANIGGAFLESSGIFNLSGSLTTFGSTFDLTGGAMALDAGLLTAESSFDVDGGILLLGGQGATLAGAFEQSAGFITMSGSELTSDVSFAQTGGTLALESNAVFHGTLSQTSGALITQTGGVLTVDGGFTENGGTLDLQSGGATFNGPIQIESGTIGGTTTTVSGTGTIVTEIGTGGVFTSNQSMSMTGGTLLLGGNGGRFYGSVTQSGGIISLLSGSLESYGLYDETGGTLTLYSAGAQFNNLEVQSGDITSYAPTLQVFGGFVQTGGVLNLHGRATTFGGTFSESKGSTINVLSGALQLEGSSTIAGTIAGAGKILVQSGSTTISTGAVITLPTIEVLGGTLTFGQGEALKEAFSLGPNGQLNTEGYSLTLDAEASLDGEIVAGSSVFMAGGGSISGSYNAFSLDGTSRLYLTSTVEQTGNMSLGDATGSRTLFDVEASGHLRIAGNYEVLDQSGNGEFLIAGVLNKTAGSGTSVIDTNVINTGSIGVNVGTLLFEGPTSTFGGTISGPGTFAIGGGQASFSASLSLTAERFILEQGNEQLTLKSNISYGGEWSQEGGTLWLDGKSVTVTTGGETGLDGGLVTGSGVFSAAAIASVNISGIDFEGTTTLKVAGVVNQTSSVSIGAQIGSAPKLDIAATAVWTVENNASLGGQVNNPAYQNATITNDGTLQKLNGSANSFIVGDFINAGTLTVANSLLTLNGTGTLGGTLTGNGALNLDGNYTLASGLATSIQAIDSIGGTTTLAENLTDANTWAQTGNASQVDLGGNTLTLTGLVSLEGGSLSGPGTMTSSGTTVLGDSYTIGQGTLVISGHADQVGDITVGDFSALSPPPAPGSQPPSIATLDIAAGAIYYLDDSNNIGSNGTLAVAGTLSALGGGQSVIGPSVIDTGVILDHSAALRFLGPVSGTGSIVIGAGGSLDFTGSVAASATVSFTTATGSMFLEDPTTANTSLTFDASVAGFQTGDFIEFSNLNPNPADVTLSLNGAGTVVTLSDTNGDSDSITFTAAQSLASLSVGVGPHADIALFHA